MLHAIGARAAPRRLFAALMVVAATAARADPPGEAAPPTTVYSAAELFVLAETAQRNGQLGDAEALFDALSRDPDVEVRSEARYRLGRMLSDIGRHADAAIRFRAILDEKPDARRVRLELARVLALLGDERGARRELRQAQAGGLPPAVQQIVDQFAGVLRSHKPLGGSLEVALAPDSNINRATSADTLDTIVAPLQLDEDARAQSGIGIRLGGQGYVRLPLVDSVNMLGRLSGQGSLYGRSQFNDIAASAQLGIEYTAGGDRWWPAVGRAYRWYGGPLYARTDTVGLNWLHSAGARAQLDVDIAAGRASYRANDLQDGWIYDLAIRYERALGPRSGGALSLSAQRQTARDPGYASVSGGIGLVVWREAGRTTLYGSFGMRRLEADQRLFIYPERRRDWYLRAGLGATLRQLAIEGFAPLVRLNYERNASTVGIYDFARVSIDVGVTRAF
jgi:tetratricopeptide (TPR) repeat protein